MTAAGAPLVRVQLTLNGEPLALEVAPNVLLLDLLREQLGLMGTKDGCRIGVCGLCSVLVDGAPFAACLLLVAELDGRSVRTVEGLAEDGELNRLQRAFVEHGALQCGICTPGQLITAQALLEAQPRPSESEVRAWMMGTLCRCTGYRSIVAAVLAAAGESA